MIVELWNELGPLQYEFSILRCLDNELVYQLCQHISEQLSKFPCKGLLPFSSDHQTYNFPPLIDVEDNKRTCLIVYSLFSVCSEKLFKVVLTPLPREKSRLTVHLNNLLIPFEVIQMFESLFEWLKVGNAPLGALGYPITKPLQVQKIQNMLISALKMCLLTKGTADVLRIGLRKANEKVKQWKHPKSKMIGIESPELLLELSSEMEILANVLFGPLWNMFEGSKNDGKVMIYRNSMFPHENWARCVSHCILFDQDLSLPESRSPVKEEKKEIESVGSSVIDELKASSI
jgi:hypothetical protein